MNPQLKHAVLPQATHDELARQNFLMSLIEYVYGMRPAIQGIYETQAKPRFEIENQRPPKNCHEIRQVMDEEPNYRWMGALKRTSQEMLWDSVITSIERQLPTLMERAKDRSQPLGSLTINPDFVVPAYQTAVDIHCMPGSYHSEFSEDDIAIGALYDRGTYLYATGMLGPLNDDLGQSAIHNFLHCEYPEFQPRKILDMGCSVGHSTLPYVDAYPDAEVYAIDIGAPMLRYAHARAEELGKRVHFCQQNAENTHFLDESFDLVVSHILLHEIPVPAIKNVMRECYRLLAPGGMMVHVEAPLYRHLDLYSEFISDWQTANNNEPFWSAMRQLDLIAVATEADFEADRLMETFVPKWMMQNSSASNRKSHGFSSRGSWFILAAKK